MRRLRLAVLTTAMLVVPLAAGAHPLGNFTTNQYVGIHVTGTGILVDYVLDLAEIPASQQIREIGRAGDGTITDEEADRFATTQCGTVAENLDGALDGDTLDLEPVDTVLSFPEGEAGLPTLRLECRLAASVTIRPNSVLAVTNDNFTDRLGWREMTLTTADVIAVTELPTSSITERLWAYPADQLLSPINVTTATAALSPSPGATTGDEPPPAGTPAKTSGGPVDALASLIAPSESSRAVPVAMAVALGLGVLHALSPGHGKTVMAAYLVGSRGTLGQAAGLGLAVAASHTVGVLALGLVTLWGTSTFAPEKAFPILTVISGMIVIGIGAWMLWRWFRHRGHHHDHDHDHDHAHHLPGLDGKSGWKVLASMGLAGGLVPSASAIVLLLAAVNLDRVPLGVLLIALFGLGMAATLVGVGFALVTASRFGMDRFGEAAWVTRAQRVLTPVAAVVVMTVGTVLTINAL